MLSLFIEKENICKDIFKMFTKGKKIKQRTTRNKKAY